MSTYKLWPQGENEEAVLFLQPVVYNSTVSAGKTNTISSSSPTAGVESQNTEMTPNIEMFGMMMEVLSVSETSA